MTLSTSTIARYMGPAPETVTLPKGSVACKETLDNIMSTFAVAPKMIKVVDGVHTFAGGSISTRTMIEAPEGLIIFDTGDDVEDGRKALAAFREVSDKPIKAIIYSHNHYAHGARAFMEDAAGDVMIIGHHDVNKHLGEIVTGFATGGEFPEAMGVLTARYMSQFGAQLPASGPDSGFAATIPVDMEKGAVPATHLVKTGDRLMVAGLEMEFFTDHFSDSEDTLTVWVPSMKMALNNFLWPALFNFYTLRGDVFRNPASWRDGLRVIHALEPEILINTHALPLTGKDLIGGTLERYMDAISFMIDQTLRGVSKGLGPDQLREFVRLPKALADEPHNAENYSEFSFFAPHLYHHIFGWYDGNAANIARLPEDEEARRIVKGFGGAEEVERQAREALSDNEVLWALRLVDYLYKIDPDNQVIRQLRADALREMANRSVGTILRHFSLTEALVMEGKIDRVLDVLPSKDRILQSEPGRYLSFQRIRLDPKKAGEKRQALWIVFTDHEDAEFILSVRNGVCNVIEAERGNQVDATLSLTLEDWADFYLGTVDAKALLTRSTVNSDAAEKVQSFFGMFDAQKA